MDNIQELSQVKGHIFSRGSPRSAAWMSTVEYELNIAILFVSVFITISQWFCSLLYSWYFCNFTPCGFYTMYEIQIYNVYYLQYTYLL